MTDPISAAARSSAKRLATEYGPGLASEVEAALHARGTGQRPTQYVDPVSLGSLIVSIATLAWTIYCDLRKRTPDPAPDVVVRHVRAELREHSATTDQGTDRISEIVVTEIIQAIGAPQ